MILKCLIGICIVRLSAAFESTNISAAPGANNAHVVDLNISATYALKRVGADALLYVNVSVPFIDSQSTLGGHNFCPSVYLIDFVDPIGADRTPYYQAVVDNLGLARSPCSALNFTYDGPFAHTSRRYEAVTDGWLVRFADARAVYSPKIPFNLSGMSDCGVTETESSGPVAVHGVAAGNHNTKTFEWAVNVCQVGSYGPNCKMEADEYAAACSQSRGVANLSPNVAMMASSVFGSPLVMTGSIQFVSFHATSEGCHGDQALATLSFSVVVDSFDTLLLMRYVNSPMPGVTLAYSDAPFKLSEGLYLHNLTSSKEKDTWTLTFVTECVTFSPNAFREYFIGRNTPGHSAQFTFSLSMQLGSYLVMQIVTEVGGFATNLTASNNTRMTLDFTMQDNVTEWQKERATAAIIHAFSGVDPSNMQFLDSFSNVISIAFPLGPAPLNVSLLMETMSMDLQVPKEIIAVTVEEIASRASAMMERSLTNIVISSGNNFTQALRIREILKAAAVDYATLRYTYETFFEEPPEKLFSSDTYNKIDISVVVDISNHVIFSDQIASFITEAEKAVEALDGVLRVNPQPPPSTRQPPPSTRPPPALPAAPQPPPSTRPPPAPSDVSAWSWSIPGVMACTLLFSYGGAIFVN